MVQAPGTKTNSSKNDPDGGVIAAAGRFLGFAIVAGMAMAILAAVVLLPAWQRMRVAQVDLANLQARTRANDMVIELRQREAEAIKTDPLQTRRILLDSRNYQAPGEASIVVAGGQAAESVRQLLDVQPASEKTDPQLATAAVKVQRPEIRNLLLITAGVMLTLAVAVFMPAGRSKS